jgi:hypothetical protein
LCANPNGAGRDCESLFRAFDSLGTPHVDVI